MPQMAPMWWTLIMIFTLLTLIITITINYFNNKMIIKSNTSMKTNKMNWTW